MSHRPGWLIMVKLRSLVERVSLDVVPNGALRLRDISFLTPPKRHLLLPGIELIELRIQRIAERMDISGWMDGRPRVRALSLFASLENHEQGVQTGY